MNESAKVEGGPEGGPKNSTPEIGRRLNSAAGSPRHLTLPIAVCNVLTALIEGMPDMPLQARVELRNARAAVRRAYRLPQWGDAIELAWEHEEDATLP